MCRKNNVLARLGLLIIVSYIYLFSPRVFSQNARKADSLLYELKNSNLSKKERAKLLTDIAFWHTKLDTALILAKEALGITQEIDAPFLEAGAWEEIGGIEHALGNKTLSLKATLKALKIYESLGLQEEQAASYAQLANSNMADSNYESAIQYLTKAKEIYKEKKKDAKLIYTTLNLGEAYRLANKIDSAKFNFIKVLKENKKLKDAIVQSYSQGNLGMIYNAQDSLALAKVHLKAAINTLKELEDSYATSVYLAELGTVYQKEGNLKIAEEKFLESLDMAQESGLKEQARDFSAKLTLFYEGQGDYLAALRYQKLFQVYQDSLVNKTNIKEIERLKAGYEIDKRESTIGLLNKVNTNQKHMVWTLGGAVLVTLVFLYWIFKVNKRVKKANVQLTEQKEIIGQREQEKALLLQELNHRVKNNLQMISSLLSLHSRELTGHPAKEALESGKDRVEALSLVHRKLYQEGVETRIALKEYLEELVLGLFHGYNASFEPTFELEDANVSVDTAVPLALIVNELVVNALKYAYEGVNHPSFALKLTTIDSNMIVQIIDNGKGFTPREGEKKNSFGLKLIRSLTEQLEGTVKKMDGDGTHWQVQLKVA